MQSKKTAKKTILFMRMYIYLGIFAITTGAYCANADEKTPNKLIKTQHLVVNLNKLPKVFDPQDFDNTNLLVLLSSLYEGLVIKNDIGNPIAGAATSWTNENNRVFVFKLRDDLRWSNGDKLSAEEFVYGFQRILNPKYKNPYTWYMKLMNIKNTDAILAGKMPLSKLGVKALDSRHLRIELEKPLSYFLDMLTYGIMIPIHKKSYEKNSNTYWHKLDQIIVNGAYKVKKISSKKLELIPNTNYWDKKNVKIRRLSFIETKDMQKQTSLFFAKKLHISGLIKPDKYWSLVRQKPQNIVNIDFLNSHYYQFQSQKKPFNNKKLRKALSYAIDRNYIVNGVLSQQQKSIYTIIPKTMMDETTYKASYSLLTQQQREKEAKMLFKQAGYNKDRPLKFKLLVDETVKNKITEAKVIIKMWQKVLKFIEVELVVLPIKDYLAAIRNKTYDLTKINWVADYKDMSSFLSILYSLNYANSYYVNKTYDQILFEAMEAKTEKQQLEAYNKLLRIIDEDMPIIPLYQDTNTYLVNKNLIGFPNTRSDGTYYVKDLYFSEEE